MKKTLCYSLEFRYSNYIFNEGFIIVEIVDDKIVNIEGVLTDEYIKFIFDEQPDIEIKVYRKFNFYDNNMYSYLTVKVNKEDFEIPFDIFIDLKDNYMQFKTIEKLPYNPHKILLDEMKSHNVFIER